MKLHLSIRLFLSYAAVAIAGAACAYLTVRLIAPRLFDQRMAMMQQTPPGMGRHPMAMSDLDDAFISSLDRALLVGLAVSLLLAGIVALLVTRRLLRPLAAVREATSRIAGGDYQVRVPVPSDPETAELAADVNTLAETLAETESRRMRLLGDVAHEMRTPLTTLDGYVEGMIDDVFPADAANLSLLGGELQRLHRLADDLATLSRAQEQRLDLAPVDADLGDLTLAAAGRLRQQFADQGVSLTVEPGPALPVSVDPDRIVQVITNLLGNALIATPAGGTVSVTTVRVQDWAQVQVRDTGVGLAESDLERIFERFYRADGQPRRSPGSGIGLTIARDIAHAHHGTLAAASPGPGQGSTFTLAVPLQ